jgi:ubiquinone/menaquinone biosynthesis C-methylase UbiE
MERWNIAQTHEKYCWDEIVSEEEILSTKDVYKKKVSMIFEMLRKEGKTISPSMKFLQVGCGPFDIINVLPIVETYSIDPLADFYKSKFSFDYKKSNLTAGSGEKLPYPDNYFDVVILANVLDHTYDPEKVLHEIRRVLKPNGFFYFELHFYQKSFLILSKVFGAFKKFLTGKIFNPCHPHMFQLFEVKGLLSRYFSVIHEKIGLDLDHKVHTIEELKAYRKSEKITRSLPAHFGILGIINYLAFCKKK